MADLARDHWNERYRGREVPVHPRAHWLEGVPGLPCAGAALDVACGTGRSACFMARSGLAVLGVDVSDVALELAVRALAAEGLALRTSALDLEREALPAGPFAMITCMHYLQRSLWCELAERLAAGGVLACEIATVTNLERYARPSRRWLVERGELGSALRSLGLVPLLEVEDWCDGTHVARVVVRK